MGNLIYRKDLKEHIGSYAGMFTDELGFVVSMEAVLRGIDFAADVDAVEVVRCKDCKHVKPTCDGRLVCGATLNPNWVCGEHFCSYGEKENDG